MRVTITPPHPPRPTSWGELVLAALLAALLLCLALGVGVPFAQAGGPVAFTWSQSTDCAVVTGWEVLVAPITTSQPNPQPTNATLGVSIPNSGTPPCGTSMTKVATVTSGVGPQRFWLRSVAGAFKSVESNSSDASMPLGKPSGFTAVPE